MKRKNTKRRLPAGALRTRGGAVLGWLGNPIKETFASIGAAIRTERTLEAVPIGPGRRQLSKVYSYALYGTAILILLAWFNNRPGFAAAVLLALILALVYVVWAAHRAVFLTVAVVLWWLVTGPFIAVLTVDDMNVQQLAKAQITSSMPLFWATGVAVWMIVLLMRVRRPWLAMLNCWAIVSSTILAVSYWDSGNAFYVAWSALALYLGWRSGLFLAIWDAVRLRTSLGRDYEDANEAQYVAYKEINRLPRAYRTFRQLAVPDVGASEYADALVAGPTGLFYIAALEAEGEITVSAGRPRRVLVNKKNIDKQLVHIASVARDLRSVLDLDLKTIVILNGGEFPNRGLLSATARPPNLGDEKDNSDETHKSVTMEGPEPLTLLDPELLMQRLKFGPTVYTVGQLQRVVHRIRVRLVPARPKRRQPADDPGSESADHRLALR